MIQVVHISAECYPVAKVGGLADVVGSLPKYLIQEGVDTAVLMPMYHNDWIHNHEFELVFKGTGWLSNVPFSYSIEREKNKTLGFNLFVINIPGRFDRAGVYIDPSSGYPYWDEFERYMSFQIAALDWIRSLSKRPDIIHCHDHHTGLIPFMMTQSKVYEELKNIPTVFTIHNGMYQGSYEWSNVKAIPHFSWESIGLLDWSNRLNSMASAIKCSWAFTTVSPQYLKELTWNSRGLESLISAEIGKSYGILNGIDVDVWNPQTDPMIPFHYSEDSLDDGKRKNRDELIRLFNLDSSKPIISYIGRFAAEKGADLLPSLFSSYLQYKKEVNFLVLGTGDPTLVDAFNHLKYQFPGYFSSFHEYNEALSHLIYAGSDFIMMPSRVEPCGLNQLFALRYGTIPIVRSTGGLIDSVIDIDQDGGYGIRFDHFNLDDGLTAIERAVRLFANSTRFKTLQKRSMLLDFSWNRSASIYIQLYQHLIKKGRI
jgi:starch synthase